MKAVSAILFTILYTLFSCFAVTGFAAAKCPLSTCKQAEYTFAKNGITNTDDNCSHPLTVTIHTIQKQTSSTHGGGNKYLLLSSINTSKNSDDHTSLSYKQGCIYSKANIPASCPLFIKHCVFLI